MATDILKLKKEAVAKGMPKDKARSATRSVLEAFLTKPARKAAPVKKASAPVKKAPARKAAPATRKPAAKKAPVRKPAAKKSAPAKAPATRTTAKRPATTNGDAGRNLLGSLDFSVTDGWNPRAGSAVDVIFRSLKKYRGNVDKVFDALLPNIADFVGAKMQDGTKRTKASRESMLRYRISRTKFDFAIRTGQHEIATERIEYGTGPYASTRAKKPARPKAKPNNNATRAHAARPATRRPAAKKAVARKR